MAIEEVRSRRSQCQEWSLHVCGLTVTKPKGQPSGKWSNDGGGGLLRKAWKVLGTGGKKLGGGWPGSPEAARGMGWW